VEVGQVCCLPNFESALQRSADGDLLVHSSYSRSRIAPINGGNDGIFDPLGAFFSLWVHDYLPPYGAPNASRRRPFPNGRLAHCRVPMTDHGFHDR
jgi:hypothetical protein